MHLTSTNTTENPNAPTVSEKGTGKSTGVSDIRHPLYTTLVTEWEKFRLTYKGGDEFLEKYLRQYNTRETAADFAERKAISYIPAHAKSAVREIQNSIYSRLADITRVDGPISYKNAIAGEADGVDRAGRTMTSFIGQDVLPDLLSISKIGVYIDKDNMPEEVSALDAGKFTPYLYTYAAEDILSWAYGRDKQLQAVLLRTNTYVEEPRTGLPVASSEEYMFLQLTDTGVEVQLYDNEGRFIKNTLLKITKIPFVIFEISDSLLTDAASYQISSLNLASADMHYAQKGNFPFYVEQVDPRVANMQNRPAGPSADGTADRAKIAKDKEVTAGPAKGRQYMKGLDRPDFIHPSPEPMRISMDKQDVMKREIRQLVHLNLTNIDPKSASAESKKADTQGLEAGLAAIGMVLEHGERQIAGIWSEYEGSDETITIKYPTEYSLMTESERREKASELRKMLPDLPSRTYQIELAKQIATTTIGHSVSSATMNKILNEIESATVIVTDPDVIRQDVEAGLLGEELASEARGYPEGEHIKARNDRAARIALTQVAQTAPGDSAAEKVQAQNDAQAKGLPASSAQRGDQLARTEDGK